MYRGHGGSRQYGHSHGPVSPSPGHCDQCMEDADFSMELGQREWVRVYEDSAHDGSCIHMPENRHQLEALERQLPRELRLHADPPGRRPRGPSHLTLSHHVLDADDRAHRDPYANEAPPSWPAYRDRSESAGESLRGTSHQDHHGTNHHGPSRHGPSRHGTSHYGSSHYGTSRHGSSHAHGSSAGGIGLRPHSGRRNYDYDDPLDPVNRHMNERWGGSGDGSDSGRDDLSSSGSIPWTSSQVPDYLSSSGSGEFPWTGSQSRPGMGERRRSDSPSSW
ncbi:hypothetical protein MMC29_003039 [Sticta canariensis]|nr:hypothetical protein [Sticta canariensis]